MKRTPIDKEYAEIILNDFRAIKSADIKLKGITVVAGINGCGKSTMSKYLYNCFYYANNYEELVLDYHKNEINSYNDLLEQLATYVGENSYIQTLSRFLRTKDYAQYIITAQKIQNAFLKKMMEQKDNSDKSKLDRLLMIFENGLNQSLTIDNMVDKCIDKIENVLKDTKGKIETRQDKFLTYKLSTIFPEIQTRNVDFKELGVSYLFSNNLPIPYSVKDVYYLDSPIMQDSYENEYWRHLNEALQAIDNNIHPEIKEINEFIMGKEVINGTSYYDYNTHSFRYKTLSGEYNLYDCATGIQSFSILQMLLNNGKLGKSTLLVIDEPEVHLHPQWVVEYARLIVLLHKQLGVKFFIASHNPDMVSAIKYISEKEGIDYALDYYLAQITDDGKYQYQYSGKDIEDIFNSFNLSFDKLRSYVN